MAGDDAAAVDVADQQHRHARGRGEAHVGDVAGAQVDLGRAAGALDQDEVGLGRAGDRSYRAPSAAASASARDSRAAWHCRTTLALHHDLRADLALRLQQDRVHVHRRRHAAGARLQRLGAADLAAVGGDGGVVRHVLRLERPHPQAARA